MPEAPPSMGPAILAQSVGRLVKETPQLKYQVHDISIEPTQHQLRVSKSLAKLNIPSWYSDRPRTTPDRSGWRKERREKSSWRRKCGTQSCAVSRPTTPDNISMSSSTITLRHVPSSRSAYRWSYVGGKENNDPVNQNHSSTSENNTSTSSFLSHRQQPYLGWRAQSKVSSILSTPTQRLASTLLTPHLSRIAE